jgi:hypothetical protein
VIVGCQTILRRLDLNLSPGILPRSFVEILPDREELALWKYPIWTRTGPRVRDEENAIDVSFARVILPDCHAVIVLAVELPVRLLGIGHIASTDQQRFLGLLLQVRYGKKCSVV